MFSANVTIDQRSVNEFMEALDAYVDFRQDKSYHYALNRAAKDVAARAAQLTHRASLDGLRAMLGQAAAAKGRRRSARATSAAAAILAARIRKTGHKPPPQPDWDEMVRKFVGRTLRSANFMRSGWLPAFKKLSLLVHQSSGVSQSIAFGRTKEDERGEFAKHPYPRIGDAIPAREIPDGLGVEIVNESVNPRNATSWSKGLGLYGVRGLEAALAFKAADMLSFIEKAADERAEKARLL